MPDLHKLQLKLVRYLGVWLLKKAREDPLLSVSPEKVT